MKGKGGRRRDVGGKGPGPVFRLTCASFNAGIVARVVGSRAGALDSLLPHLFVFVFATDTPMAE